MKIDYLKQSRELEHPLFLGLPMELLVKRKSLKSIAPSAIQPQVSRTLLQSIMLL
jgi:hypothetical protein